MALGKETYAGEGNRQRVCSGYLRPRLLSHLLHRFYRVALSEDCWIFWDHGDFATADVGVRAARRGKRGYWGVCAMLMRLATAEECLVRSELMDGWDWRPRWRNARLASWERLNYSVEHLPE